MPIKLKIHNGHRTGPVFVCDVCKEVVTDWGDAMACWLPKSDEKLGDVFPFVVTCKDDCLRRLDARFGHMFTQSLDAFVIYLANNSGINLKQARQTVDALSMI